jgi:hypothetical protein
MTRPPARNTCAISWSVAADDLVETATASMADKPIASATAVTAPLNSLSMFFPSKQRLVGCGTRVLRDDGLLRRCRGKP